MNVNKITANNKFNSQNRVNFGSKNSPVKPFTIPTDFGKLKVEELKWSDGKKAAKFSFDTAVESFDDWAGEYTPTETKNLTDYFKEIHARALRKRDGNSTVLVAKDSKRDVKALFFMHNFDEFAENGVVDVKTGHLEECLIAPQYRSQGIGRIILDALTKTADGHFTDIFAEADNKALSFYKRAGFKELDVSNPAIKKISDFILAGRSDANLITLISKSVGPTNSWWKRVAKRIK